MRQFAMVVILLAVGYGLGFLVSNNSSQAEYDALRASTVDRGELDDTQALLNASNEKVGALSEENDALAEENSKLKGQIGSLEATLEETKKRAAVVNATATTEESALALSFGKFAGLKELADADWDKIGSSMLSLREGILDIIARYEAGEEVSQEDWMKLQEHNMPLVAFALAVNGKLPTHGQINGVFTHPLAQINMMSEMLAGSDLALSDSQASLLEELGMQFELDWEDMDGGYAEGSLALQKLLDEADLKRDFLARIEEGLTPDQRDIIFPDASRDVNMLDLFSPALMFSETGRPMMVRSEEDLRSQMMQNAGAALGMSADDLAPYQHVFDDWVSDVSGLLKPIAPDDAMFYDLDTGLTAGRAQVTAVEALADALDLSEDVRKRLSENKIFFVPRMIAQPEEDGGK